MNDGTEPAQGGYIEGNGPISAWFDPTSEYAISAEQARRLAGPWLEALRLRLRDQS